jgi:hypothetical protein
MDFIEIALLNAQIGRCAHTARCSTSMGCAPCASLGLPSMPGLGQPRRGIEHLKLAMDVTAAMGATRCRA